MSFEFDRCICVVDEVLNCKREEGNFSDPYAVAVIKSGNIVGHVPRWTFAACNSYRKGVLLYAKLLAHDVIPVISLRVG